MTTEPTAPLAAVRIVPAHGSRARYNSRQADIRCRCSRCTAANTRYIARHRAGTWAPSSYRQLSLDELA